MLQNAVSFRLREIFLEKKSSIVCLQVRSVKSAFLPVLLFVLSLLSLLLGRPWALAKDNWRQVLKRLGIAWLDGGGAEMGATPQNTPEACAADKPFSSKGIGVHGGSFSSDGE